MNRERARTAGAGQVPGRGSLRLVRATVGSRLPSARPMVPQPFLVGHRHCDGSEVHPGFVGERRSYLPGVHGQYLWPLSACRSSRAPWPLGIRRRQGRLPDYPRAMGSHRLRRSTAGQLELGRDRPSDRRATCELTRASAIAFRQPERGVSEHPPRGSLRDHLNTGYFNAQRS